MTALEIVGLSVAYGCAGLICARLMAGHLAYTWHRQDHYITSDSSPNSGRWFGGWCLGLMVGMVWPLALVVHKLRLERYAIGAEATALRTRQEQRIKELEKELHIS